MTTKISRPVRRELPHMKIGETPLIVGIEPDGMLSFRLKGSSRTLEIPASTVYEYAYRASRRAHKARLRAERLRRKADRVIARMPDESELTPEGERIAALFRDLPDDVPWVMDPL